MRRRALGLLLVLIGVVLVGILTSPPAHAIDLPPIPNPIGDAILEKICPPRQAPYPAAPAAVIVDRGGGPGLYANYGYAGLRWTTWDAGCLSWDKADTSIGSQINAGANAVDELINEVQVAALDDRTTSSFDGVIERAVGGLRDAFWNPWSMTGLAVMGLLFGLYLVSGRETDALALLGSGALVVLLMFTLFSQPHLPAQVGDGLTSGVAQGVAGSLVAATPGGTMPATATPVQKFAEGFYQVSYQAWLDGWTCGDADAAARYGRRLLNDQAFSVAEVRATWNDPAAAEALVKAKQDDWVKVGEEMPKTNPVAFGCWKGEGQSRTGAAVKHAIVTISAGFWIVLGSVALLALRWVLRLAVLFAAAFGAIMLFSRRMQDRMMEFVLLGLLGPPFVAAGVGVLLWGYYAILLSPGTSWWQAGIAAFALGLAVWFAKGILQRLFVGVREVSRGGTMMRRGTRRATAAVSAGRAATAGAGAGSAAATGGAAGAAAALALLSTHDGHDDARRPEPDALTPDTEETGSMDAPRKPDPDDAPGQALARARAMAANRGYVPEGFERSVAVAEHHGDDARDYVPTGDPEWTDPDT